MRRRQTGTVLVVALIMLVLVTMLAVTSFNLGKSNLQIVSNMQHRNEAIAAGREAIEEVLSSTRFFATPEDALASPCNGNSNTRCVDSNGDGRADVIVTLSPPPSCIKAQTIKTIALDPALAEDVGCTLGVAQSFGVVGTITGDSLCANSLWDITAGATDAVTETRVALTQGVSVRVAKDDIATNCP